MDYKKSKYWIISRLDRLLSKEKEIKKQEKILEKREKQVLKKESELLEVESKLREDLEHLKRSEHSMNIKRNKLDSIVDQLISREKKVRQQELKKKAELYQLLKTEKKAPDPSNHSLIDKEEQALRNELKELINKKWEDEEEEKKLIKQEENLLSREEKTIKERISDEDDLLKVQEKETNLIKEETAIEKERLKLISDLESLKKDEYSITDKPEEPQPLLFKPAGGEIYLLDENQILVSGVIPWRSLNFFSKNITTKRPGLCITRTNPIRLMQTCNMDNIDCAWLSESGVNSSEYKRVYSLEEVLKIISDFINKNKQSAVMVDGLEYLITNNGFHPTLSFIEYLRDLISEKDTYILLPADFNSLKKHHLRQLGRECNTIY
jgi:hypothetical protein